MIVDSATPDSMTADSTKADSAHRASRMKSSTTGLRDSIPGEIGYWVPVLVSLRLRVLRASSIAEDGETILATWRTTPGRA